MCVVCGCSQTGAANAATDGNRGFLVDTRTGDLHFGAGAARVSVPGMSQARRSASSRMCSAPTTASPRRTARTSLAHGVTALNLVSSPGSGKTTLLCATIEALRRPRPLCRWR
jgi:hydrogenase nickel incorporation protein HypB